MFPSWEYSQVYFEFLIANSADHDKIPHSVARIQLGLPDLPEITLFGLK